MKTTTLEVMYEDRVLKPLSPVEGWQEHERAWVVIRAKPAMGGIRRLKGVFSRDEAETLRSIIDHEFEKIEGNWQTGGG